MNIPLYTSKKISDETVARAVDAIIQNKSLQSDAEREICRAAGVDCAKAVNGPYDALKNLLYSWQVCKGEAVFVPSFTEPFVLNAVMECGAAPVFVDCDRETWLMSPEKLENAVKKCIKQNELYPRAVIVSDMFGLPFDAVAFGNVCAKYGLLLIEDVSCSLGAQWNGKKAGTLGDAAFAGFTSGGGAMLTNDRQLAKRFNVTADGGIRTFANTTGAREAACRGTASVMDTFSAIGLIDTLPKLDETVEKRRKTAEKLRSAVSGTAVTCQKEKDGILGAYPVFAVKAADKDSADRMVKAFREEGIECNAMFSRPLCRQEAFKELGVNISDMPAGSELSVCTFLLPCHEELTEEQIKHLCDTIKKICI